MTHIMYDIATNSGSPKTEPEYEVPKYESQIQVPKGIFSQQLPLTEFMTSMATKYIKHMLLACVVLNVANAEDKSYFMWILNNLA